MEEKRDTHAAHPAPPPPQPVQLDLRQFLEPCLRCHAPLDRELYIARCGHVYHGRCCVGWKGCVICNEVLYVDTEPIPASPPSSPPPAQRRRSRQAPSHADADDEVLRMLGVEREEARAEGEDNGSVLRQHLGNRKRRSTRGSRSAAADSSAAAAAAAASSSSSSLPSAARSASPSAVVVRHKDLTRLYFEPLAVLEQMFAAAGPHGAQMASQSQAADQNGQPAPDSPTERAELLQRRRTQLEQARRNLAGLRQDLTHHTELLHQSSASLVAAQADAVGHEQRAARYGRKLRRAHSDAYKLERRVAELEGEVGKLLQELVELDWAEWSEEQAAAAADAVANAPAHDSFLPHAAPTRLSSLHRYRNLAHNDLWRDLLLLDPNLLFVSHAAASAQQAEPSAVLSRAQLAERMRCAVEQASETHPAVPCAVDLRSLGASELPSLCRRETAAELARLARTEQRLQALGLELEGVVDAPLTQASLPPHSEPTEGDMSVARGNSLSLHMALHRLLADAAADPAAARTRMDELAQRLRVHEATLCGNAARAAEQAAKVARMEAEMARLQALPHAPTPAAPQPTVSLPPRKKPRSDPPSAGDAMDLTAEADGASWSDEQAEEMKAAMEDEARMDNCSSTPLSHSALPLSRSTSSASPSFLRGLAPSLARQQSAKQRLKLAMGCVEAVARFGGTERLERFSLERVEQTASEAAQLARESRAAAAALALQNPRSKLNAFGIPSAPSPSFDNPVPRHCGSSALLTASTPSATQRMRDRPRVKVQPVAQSAASTVVPEHRAEDEADFIVSGHDGRGGHVVLRREQPAGHASMVRPNPAALLRRSFSAASPASTSLFALDSLAYGASQAGNNRNSTVRTGAASGLGSTVPAAATRDIATATKVKLSENNRTTSAPQHPRPSAAAASVSGGVVSAASSRSASVVPSTSSSSSSFSHSGLFVDLSEDDGPAPPPHPFFARGFTNVTQQQKHRVMEGSKGCVGDKPSKSASGVRQPLATLQFQPNQ